MRILALIPARGGSKRLPGKNVKLLGGRPLIEWSIDVVSGVPEICDVLVSTDDAAIAEVSRKAGALVPWLRPDELASDTAATIDVALHALNWYENEKGRVDGLLLLQPTSPFRTRASVQRGVDLFRLHCPRPVFGVAEAASHPMWSFRIEQNALHPFIDGAGLGMRSQDLPKAYVINGAFYLISTDRLRDLHSFFADDMMPLLFEQEESVDIDTALDWKIAEAILRDAKAT